MRNNTEVYICRKARIVNNDPRAYDQRYFESALTSILTTLTNVDKSFSTLDQASAYVKGNGMIAIYKVVVPKQHIKNVNSAGEVNLDRRCITIKNIEGLHYPECLGKGGFVANPSFNKSLMEGNDKMQAGRDSLTTPLTTTPSADISGQIASPARRSP